MRVIKKGMWGLVMALVFSLGTFVTNEAAGNYQIGDYKIRGTVSFGGRAVDIDKNEAKYEEDYNLMRGMRLFDLSLRGEAREKTDNFIDYFRIEGHNWGGDPYPWGYIRLGKHDLFELKITRQEIDYKYSNLGFPFIPTGDPHIFDWTRKFTQIDFTLTPKDLPKFSFSYRRQWQNGESTITREIFQDEFQLFYPVHKLTNDYKFGLDYSIGPIDLSIEQELRLFNDKITYFLPAPSSGGQFGSNAATELDAYDWHQSETYTIPITTIKLHSYFCDRVELNLGYIFSKSDMDYSFTNKLLGRNFFGVDLQQNRRADRDSDQFIHIVDLGLSFRILDNFFLHTDYRFHSTTSDADMFTEDIRIFPSPLFALFSPIIRTALAKTDDDIRANTIGTVLEYIPVETLSLRLGYRFQDRFASSTQDRIIQRKINTRNKSLVAGFDFNPWKMLTISSEYENGSIDNPYTRISSTDEDNAKFKIKFKPRENLSTGFGFTIKDRKNTTGASDYVEKSYSANIWYHPFKSLSLIASYTRQDLELNTEIVEALDLNIEPIRAADFSEDNDIYVGGITYNITQFLTTDLNVRYTDARGTFPLDVYDFGWGLSYRFKVYETDMSLNLDYRHVALYEQRDDYGGRINDYDADLVTIYIKGEF
jgi:hypothetical protein